MDDLISRQAAIDALRKMQTYKLFSGDDMLLIDQAGAQTELMLLPSANDTNVGTKLGTNLAEVGTDTISRDAVKELLNNNGLPHHINPILWKELNELPPIQPKRGQWIDDGSELGCQCSQCGKTLDEYINCGTEYMTLTEIPKFCPNCGAKMEGADDE